MTGQYVKKINIRQNVRWLDYMPCLLSCFKDGKIEPGTCIRKLTLLVGKKTYESVLVAEMTYAVCLKIFDVFLV